MKTIDTSQAAMLVRRYYDLEGNLETLVGYSDLNFKLTTSRERYVVKFSTEKQEENIKKEINMMTALEGADESHIYPQLIRTNQGEVSKTIQVEGNTWILRIISWLDGQLYAESEKSAELHRDLGKKLGSMDKRLMESNIWNGTKGLDVWDLQLAHLSGDRIHHIQDPEIRRLAHYYLQQFEHQVLPNMMRLRKCMIHADPNDYNLLVSEQKISGIFDFGDSVYGPVINDLAVALSYVLTDQDDIDQASKDVVKSFHQVFPLEELEIELLYWLIAARLSVTVAQAAYSRHAEPENAYRLVSEKPAKQLLLRWVELSPIGFTSLLKTHLGMKVPDSGDVEKMKAERLNHVNPSLSISFKEPIKMVRAAFQYMYAQDGTTYLDCVNNICHVGHCHPQVVDAASNQMARLNTNTRYLYDSLNAYSSKLASKFPAPLEVVYLVNSGSEAGDLAQRITRTVTGHKETIVVDHAYHGNTIAGIEVSPYKYKGKGGAGKQKHIYQMPSPDSYSKEEIVAGNHTREVDDILDQSDRVAAFYCESIVGCGGQVVLPDNYLQPIYEAVRSSGGLCIADEVQVGFGRVGDTFWGFELQNVVPDIVVVGKPMGNGHPMAAVITTAEIAEAFNNGMEYFSSFGGNPVSCEIGLAVLDVIEKENLQEQARITGDYFISELRKLQAKYSIIKDVRGHGLFIGVELEEEGSPATVFAKSLVEFMKQRHVLLSLDGPYNNVIKIKPPMTFNQSNADTVIEGLNTYLEEQ